MTELIDYTLRVLPGTVLVAMAFVAARPVRDPMFRILLLILGFVLIRDAMTPAGFWTFGVTDSVPWLRFTDRAELLVALGATTLAFVGVLLRWVPDLRELVVWGRLRPATVGLGIGGGVAVAAPVLAFAQLIEVDDRGGAVAVSLLPALLFLALAGNLGEEVLFRGFLQGRLEQSVSPVRAAVLSGVLFAACHAFLASTVTDLGWPLLAFTLYEGLICAFLRMRWGVWPAALAHGTGIFLLASGLL